MLAGDDGAGDIFPLPSLPIGAYTLTATPFPENGAGGIAGTPVMINFVVPAVNTPPTVTITAPADGASSPSNIPLNFAGDEAHIP